MHTLRELSRSLGAQHVLPGILLLIISVLALCVWETRRLTGRQTGGARDRLIALSGIVLGAASFVLIAARFLWVA
jgi:hypothetical protein